MLKHTFDQKLYFFHPNLRTLNMYALASFKFGFTRSNISKNVKNILCIRQNHVLVEFFQTMIPAQNSKSYPERLAELNLYSLEKGGYEVT